MLVLVFEVNGATGHHAIGDAGAQPDIEALGPEHAQSLPRDRPVAGAEELGLRLEQNDFGTEPAPYAAKLEPDHTGADHAEALRHLGEPQRSGGIDDDVAL